MTASAPTGVPAQTRTAETLASLRFYTGSGRSARLHPQLATHIAGMSNTSPAATTVDASSDALLFAAAARRGPHAGHRIRGLALRGRSHDWLVALSLQQVDNYLIVALDRELHALLTLHGIPCVLRELKGSLGDLWVERVRVFAALCAAGIDFIHSDVDALNQRVAAFTARRLAK